MSVEPLTANVRHSRGKKANRRLRFENKIPAILYGVGEMMALEMEEETTRRIISRLAGLHQLISLQITNEKDETTEHQVLVQEIQKHPYRRELLHLDFCKLDDNKPVTLKVPLKTIGSSPGVKKGGIIQMVVREIPITCLPANIPDVLEVDVSNLDFHQTIRVENVNCPHSVSINANENYSIATIIGRKTVEEEDE